jgi:hypothetical protein
VRIAEGWSDKTVLKLHDRRDGSVTAHDRLAGGTHRLLDEALPVKDAAAPVFRDVTGRSGTLLEPTRRFRATDTDRKHTEEADENGVRTVHPLTSRKKR